MGVKLAECMAVFMITLFMVIQTKLKMNSVKMESVLLKIILSLFKFIGPTTTVPVSHMALAHP